VSTFPRTFAVALGLSLAAGSASAQTTAQADFWSALGDSTLVRLVHDTRLANRDIQIAAARAREARAQRTGAALDLFPVVTTSGGYSRQRLASATFPGASGAFPDQNVWDAGLNMSWEMDVFGRLRHAYRARGALADAAAEDVRDVQVVLTSQTAGAYLALRGAQERLAVARRNSENQRRTLELTERRLEGGRGTRLDTERAHAQLSATLAVIPALESTIELARQRLRVLTGSEQTEPLALGPCDSGLALPDLSRLEVGDAVLRDRPDVRSAERQLAASHSLVGAARAEYLPRLSLGAAAGYTGAAARTLGNTGTPRYAIGPVVSWPALDLGHVRAGVDVARAAEAQQRARYEQTVALAREELESTLVTYRKARERLGHLDEAAAASARAADLARLRYSEGASDFLLVLDPERTLLERENDRATGRTEAEQALIAVYRALGGGSMGVAAAR
jgi:NodT family efflux transporter outer membrane factor (OMF) lipoprotein